MPFRVEVSEVIDRPVGIVFHFYADEHVKNHPRWDPVIELWLESVEPLALGTIIQRRNTRSGTPVRGTMEVVEFERDRAFGVVIREGPMEIPGRATFEPIGPSQTKLTVSADFPLDGSMQGALTTAMKRSVTNIKQMMEEETG